MTGIRISVRPKRRYFMRGRYAMPSFRKQCWSLIVVVLVLVLVLGRSFGLSGRAQERGRSHDKLQFRAVRDESALVGLSKEPSDRLTPFRPVVECPVVHVHADELVREITAHVARESQRVLHGFGTVSETVSNARSENFRNCFACCRIEPFVNYVAAEGQGEAVILAAPPDTEIFTHDQSLVWIRELSFVNDETNVGLFVADGFEDLIEWHDDVIDVWIL